MAGIVVLKLFVLRAMPLFLRPAAVLLEGMYIDDGVLLIQVIPISMMALAISSIPVHLDYFRTHIGQEWRSAQYMSAVTWITVIAVVVLLTVLIMPPLEFGLFLATGICFTFLIEKLADEACRALEFRKAFIKWFFVQSLRSGWLFLPILASFVGYSYPTAFLVISAFMVMITFVAFQRITMLWPNFAINGVHLIRGNLVFLTGSILPASYRQVPRIIVAKLYPEYAHIYLALSQLAQGISLMFKVRFQIPYRKIIARHTRLFQRILKPAMRRILVPAGSAALLYLFISLSIPLWEGSTEITTLVLVPIVIADTLTFAIVSVHVGYIPWFSSRSYALVTYVMCISVAAACVTVTSILGVGEYLSLMSIPALTILIGFIWLHIISVRHFSVSYSNA